MRLGRTGMVEHDGKARQRVREHRQVVGLVLDAPDVQDMTPVGENLRAGRERRIAQDIASGRIAGPPNSPVLLKAVFMRMPAKRGPAAASWASSTGATLFPRRRSTLATMRWANSAGP